MKILVIEDDEKIASFIAKGLKENGYDVDMATDGLLGQSMAEQEQYDAVVADIMLPSKDGLKIVQDLRAKNISIPVIFLSAKSSVEDRIAGLQAGGDDYLGKPFAISELTARIQALIRRSTVVVQPSETTLLSHGDLKLNLLTREVYRGEKKIELQTREFTLLEYLLRNAGKCVTKTLILGHVWDYNFDPQTNVVDVLVCRLRNKIDKGFKTSLIHTIRGMGYVLKQE
ncbi:MAG: response regulator transcription factor [Verrucomicrobia bacterium]|jgi:DNA-binding response OmpR family regulator|nr:response regulator transcription factor [Verrucomicrobiota bacterium]